MVYTRIYSIGAQSVDYSNDGEFKQWVSQYYNGDDLEKIYPTWRRNADFVKYHNSLDLSYTVAMNKFTHLVSNLLLLSSSYSIVYHIRRHRGGG